jgi:hypothetical protein
MITSVQARILSISRAYSVNKNFRRIRAITAVIHRNKDNNFLISIGNDIIIELLSHVIKWLLYFFLIFHISPLRKMRRSWIFFQQWAVKYSTKIAQKILYWFAPTFSSYTKQTTCMKMLSPTVRSIIRIFQSFVLQSELFHTAFIQHFMGHRWRKLKNFPFSSAESCGK